MAAAKKAPAKKAPARAKKGAAVRVAMLKFISGTRNGEAWPRPGGTIELPEHEAADLCTAGYAREATDDDPEPGEAPAPADEPSEDGDTDG